jgi:membrane associated rhomboid family serine protease
VAREVGADSVPAAVTDAAPPTVRSCYKHPDRKAGVSCQRCDRPICPQCMHQASVGFHCPECTKQGKQQVYTRADMQVLNRPVLTFVLIGLNVAIFLAGSAYESSPEGAARGGFTLDGGLYGPFVADGEWWRIITSGFLHANLIHVAMNMFALFRIGQILEPAIGRARFGAVYVTCLLTGALGVLVLSPNELTVGASGAIFGLFGLMFLATRASGIDPWSSGIGITIGINLFITFGIPGISIGGHLGGLAGGALCGYLLYDVGPKQRWSAQQQVGIVAGIGLAAAIACIFVA